MANYTILLIDYEPRSIERFRDPLVAAGYTVEIATDGVSGIEAFHRLNPDMVLVEAMIPKKHGFEVCQELKRTPHGRRTPVLITTGVYKGRKYRTQALHIYGCDEYIEKPIAPEQLLEIVGKFFGPGSAAASARSEEPAAAPPERSADRTPPKDVPTATTAVASEPTTPKVERTKPAPAPKSLVDNDTEDEIMARLDFILPNGGVAPKAVEAPAMMVATLEAPMEIPEIAEIPEPAVELDPFAQMRAELDAELGSFSAALAVELAPVIEPVPETIPSDQVSLPSLLESLPEPAIEAKLEPARSPEPEPAPDPKIGKAGQVVNFDTKRGRKNKKAAKAEKARQQEAAAPPAPPAPPTPIAAQPQKPVPEITLPAGTLVESAIDPAAARRGMPVWMWGAAAVVVIGAAYFALSRGGAKPTETLAVPDAPVASTQTESSPAPTPEPPAAEVAAAVVPPPVTAKPSVAPKLVPEAKKLVADVPKPVAPKKSPEVAAAAPPSVAAPAKNPAKAVAAPKPAPIAAPAAPDSEESVAGVETLPDAGASAGASGPVTTIAPGTLIPLDEADVMPVSVQRKPPTYSLQAREMRLSGTVIMNVLINERGSVDQVVLVTGVPGADLNDSAIRAAKSWTYRPATMKGVPVKVWKSEQVEFKQ